MNSKKKLVHLLHHGTRLSRVGAQQTVCTPHTASLTLAHSHFLTPSAAVA